MAGNAEEVGLPKYDFRNIEMYTEEMKTPPCIRPIPTRGKTDKCYSMTTTTTACSHSGPLVTPRSVITSSSKSTPFSSKCRIVKPSVVAAIVEGRGYARGEVGMASLDLKKPVLILSQFSDTQTYVKTVTKLKILQPLEILMPHTAYENGLASQLAKRLGEYFPCASVVTVHRRYFNEVKGLQYVKHLRTSECRAVEMELTSKYYCLASVGALVKYVEFIQNVLYAPNSLKVVFTGSINTTMIDVHTAQILELVMNVKDPKSEHTLYGVLRATQTIGGSRCLRANILQPPCDMQTIGERLDCIEELLKKEEMLINLKVILGRFPDVDHLLSLCIQIPKHDTIKAADNKITYVIYLKHVLELIEPLKMGLESVHSELLKKYCDALNDPRYPMILAKINEMVHDDTKYQKGSLNMRTQKCFAVKPNINGLLDVARRTYAEIVQDAADMIAHLGETYKLPLRIGYSVAKGFFIQMNCVGKNSVTLDNLPPLFIRKVRVKNTLRCTTEDLVKLNDRGAQSLNEIYLMSNVIISKLLSDIIPSVGCLYKFTEIVSTLDMLVGFAQVSAMCNYVRPEFTDTLAIQSGRHPILERISPELPVPNDAYIADGFNFAVITGPNMSGKSTYLKQVVLLQIMAQIGCFVPAEYASFRLADHIFSRKGSSDDIESNSSTFMVEMTEVNYILSTATKKSLIIIDELGRGTSVEEGIGICWAICGELCKMKAFTMFATHFMELTYLDAAHPNVCNYHFSMEHVTSLPNCCPRLYFSHTVAEGPTPELDYGIKLAALANFPEPVIKNATRIAIEARKQFPIHRLGKEENQRRVLYWLNKKLQQVVRNSTLSPVELRDYMKSLKDEYLQKLTQVDDMQEKK